MSKIGQKIIAALEEGLEVLKSGAPLDDHFTVRYYLVPSDPTEYDGPSIRGVRDLYAMSQGIFAKFLCVSPATIKAWEQGKRKPSPIARRLLDEMVANPDYYRSRFAEMASPKITKLPVKSVVHRAAKKTNKMQPA